MHSSLLELRDCFLSWPNNRSLLAASLHTWALALPDGTADHESQTTFHFEPRLGLQHPLPLLRQPLLAPLGHCNLAA